MSKLKAFLGLIILAAIGLIGWQLLRSQKPTERMKSTASNSEREQPPSEKQSAGKPDDKQASVPPAAGEKSSAPSGAAAANQASLKVTGSDLARLGKITERSQIMIPLPGGGVATGVVQLVQTEARGLIRVGGRLTGNHRGSFSLVDDSGQVSGRVLMPQEKLAYLISSAGGGAATVQALPLSNIICYPFPLEPRPAVPVEGGSSGPQAAPPILSSRPAATAVLYLDFDGETVTDPDWPAYASDGVTITGPTIVAPASTLSNAQITEVWNRVKEDYWPFDIDVTTDLNRYNNAPLGQRMRVIITPNDAAAPGAGGVAYVGSFRLAGSPYFYFQSDNPAWVFNSSVDGIAEAISHELGHTLGLEHDGRNPPLTDFSTPDGEYYYGHGDPSSAVGWAPIMGAGYYQKLVQWSKGQYPAANNQQDDVAIISGQASFTFGGPAYTNSVGYVPDDAGNTRATAVEVNLASGAPQVTGIISSAADLDYFTFTLNSASEVTISVSPPSTYSKQANLDAEIELQVSSGFPEAYANPAAALDASITRTLSAGTYYVKVGGAGRNGSGGSDYGYDNYGSIGQYRLSIVLAAPVITSPTSATIGVGNSFSYAITATNSAGTFAATGLPAGLTINTSTGVISGRPTVTGVFNITLSASNASATGTGSLALTVTNAAPVSVTQSDPRQVLTLGGGTTLSVTGFSVNGSISYQWMRNGRPISGATSSSLVLTSATYADNGAYWLEMTNAVGTGRSAPFFVAVAPTSTQVRGWGQNSAGVLDIPSSLTDAVAVSGSKNLSVLALKSDGTVLGWGENHLAQVTIPAGLSGVVAVAAGKYHSLALKSDGTVVAWSNSSTQGGLDIPAGLTGVVAISTDGGNSVALKTDGTVATWGAGGGAPAGVTGVIAISSGDGFSLALKNDGTVIGWGSNGLGQINVPAGLTGVVAISAGSYHSLALKSDGTVVAWGYNGDGAATVPAGLSNVAAISGGQRHSLVLKSDGTVTGWGLNPNGEAAPPAEGLDKVFTISAGSGNSFALRDSSDDTVPNIVAPPVDLTRVEAQTAVFSVVAGGAGPFTYQWRKNNVDIAGATSASFTISNLVLADAGNYRVLVSNNVGSALSGVATLVVNPLPVVTNLSPARQVLTPGQNLSLSVSATGTDSLTYQWMRNGQPIAGATASVFDRTNLIFADAGYYYVAVTDNYGTRRSSAFFVTVAPAVTQVVAWGRNDLGQANIPTGLTDTVAVATGAVHSLVLKTDGTVVAVGDNNFGQTSIPAGLSDVAAIAAGWNHSLALKADGTVIAWGLNPASAVPAGLSNIVAVAGGGGHSLALKIDGTVVAWGRNTNGQSTVPAGLSNVVAIAAGENHSLALKADGSVVAWGANNFGQSSVPNTATNILALSGSDAFSLALKSDGTVLFWGTASFSGEPTRAPPAGLNNVVAISAGSGGSLALKTDGSVVTWGTNVYFGPIVVPAGLDAVFAIAKGSDHALALRDTNPPPSPPSVTLQPQDRAVLMGNNAIFTLSVTGNPGSTYQWQRLPAGSGTWSALANGGAYSGTTTATMTVTGTTLAMTGDQFRCVATNPSGSATSNPATLTVTVPLPVISAQPVAASVAVGTSIDLAVTATSPVALTYQWRKNGTDIGGATASIYTIASAQLTDAADYTVVITNSAGSVTSNAATVIVVTPPVINTQPVAQTVYAGQTASFSVTATSAAPLSYAWRKNGTPIGGATAATYTIASTQMADAADYSVVVTNLAGWVTSSAATLTVNPLAAPVITTQPVGQSAGAGVTVQFTVAASGAPAPAYQWQVQRAGGGTWSNTVDGAGYSGSQTATLSVLGSLLANNGDQYRCVASNTAGAATSNAAIHTVLEGPVITGHPQDQTGLLGLILQFNVTATAVPAPSYQWQRRPAGTGVWADLPDGIYVTGSTTPTLTVYFGAGWTDQDQVRCVVSNYLGSATSNAATLSWPQQAGVVRVAAGAGHTLLIRSDGVLYTTGANGFGQLGRGTTTNVNFGSWVDGPGLGNVYGHIIDVAAGANHSFYLKSDATLWAMGRNANGQLGTGDAANRLSPVQVAAGVAAAAPGTSHSLIIKQDGTLWATGDNTYGQLGDGTNTNTLVPKQVATHVVAAASAFVHSVFLKADGTLWSMGHNGLGELGDGSPFNRNVPVQTATGVVAFSARGYHTLFIKTDGTLWAVGYNNVGQLGDGTLDTRATPVQVATNVMAVASGMFHSLFVKTDGTLWATGDNTYGQLGTGDTFTRSSPVQVATGVIAVAAGENHSVYITTDGSYWAMGRGDSGQLGDQANQNRSSPWRVMNGYVPLPAPPTAVTASDVVYPDRIAVSWTGGLSSGYYELWRGTTNVPAAATRLSARVSTPYYEDLSVTPNQPYYYWIKGVNAAGVGAFSAGDAGTAGSIAPPVITAPPQSQTVNVGANVTFSVTASGTAPFTYQWQKGTNPIGAATASTYTITGVATTDAGSYDVVVTNGAGSVTSAAAVLTVNKLAQAITFAAPADRAYTTVPFGLVATSDSGLPVTFSIVSGPATLSGSDLTITGVGTVTVRATQGGNATYAAATNVERSFTVTKAAATVTLGSLTATYDGTAKSATATTNPAALNVTFTYEGSATPPTNAGSYAVVGTIAEANYQGTASGTLVIAKAAATLTLGSLTATYDGTAKNVTVTTSPAGLNVTFTYDGSATVPTGAGSYAVVGTITEANYEGTASGTLVIAKATATVTLGNLAVTYNGAAKSATATTNPANLAVAFTYNGSATAPTNAGSYAVVGTIAEANYQGSANGTLVIAKATATVTLGNLTPTYDGTAKSASATTTPAGLTVNLSYDGSPTAPTNAGSYMVVGTISDSNHQGSASGTLVIAKAVATVTLGNLSPTYDGTAKSATATTTPANLAVDLSYDGSATAPTNAGSYAIVGTVNEANYQGTANGTLVIAKADQTITFTGPANQPYSATPIALSATASSGLAVTFTVVSGPATLAGDSLTLTGAGAVTVRATQDGDANRNAAPAIDQSFTVTANFASWLLAKFTAEERADANISGPNADPDHDGFANLLEYALGLEPKSANTTNLPQIGTLGSDWTYTYSRPADRTDVTYTAEASTNLTNWSSVGVIHELVSTSGGFETWRAKYSLVSAPNVFFRLSVSGQ
ncbi:MAG TPA: MBG domain-containing protein [Lacunisphaera sp.]